MDGILRIEKPVQVNAARHEDRNRCKKRCAQEIRELQQTADPETGKAQQSADRTDQRKPAQRVFHAAGSPGDLRHRKGGIHGKSNNQ